MQSPRDLAQQVLGLLDLTLLDDTATEQDIVRLCDRAITPYGPVAAVCVWSRFTTLCAGRLAGSGVRVVAVANFPAGGDDPAAAEADTWQAVSSGADEVDLVFPYRAWLDGRRAEAVELVKTCKQVCGREVWLKVILETGRLGSTATIRAAAEDALEGGADFLKTSTGRLQPGASPEAATALLHAIRDGHRVAGLKVSGGVRSLAEAADYLAIAEQIMGTGWADPDTFRIGASRLLDELLAALSAD